MAGDGCSLSRPNCARDANPCTRRWSRAIRPLEGFIAEGFCGYLPRLPYPVRTGVHSNTAFGMTLALDYARAAGHRRLEAAIVSRSREFYGADADAPVGWEPGGEDFLSPSLTEADLMSRVLPAAEFPALDCAVPTGTCRWRILRHHGAAAGL
jgi:hypothetical protein